MTAMLLLLGLQTQPVVLENDYVRVTHDAAPCAVATAPTCGDRVIVALGDISLLPSRPRKLVALAIV